MTTSLIPRDDQLLQEPPPLSPPPFPLSDTDLGVVVRADDPCEAENRGARARVPNKYLHARYYDPQLGIFLSPDRLHPKTRGVGANRYSYAFGNPVNGADRSGHMTTCASRVTEEYTSYTGPSWAGGEPGPAQKQVTGLVVTFTCWVFDNGIKAGLDFLDRIGYDLGPGRGANTNEPVSGPSPTAPTQPAAPPVDPPDDPPQAGKKPKARALAKSWMNKWLDDPYTIRFEVCTYMCGGDEGKLFLGKYRPGSADECDPYDCPAGSNPFAILHTHPRVGGYEGHFGDDFQTGGLLSYIGLRDETDNNTGQFLLEPRDIMWEFDPSTGLEEEIPLP